MPFLRRVALINLRMKRMAVRILQKVKRLFTTYTLEKDIVGTGNSLLIGKNFYCGMLHIIICGNNNIVQIGDDCWFSRENWIYMSGNGNKLSIGNGVSFDDDVHFIQSEGTSISVGNDCMFAKHINIRTSDQHAIYNNQNDRTNVAKDVTIGNHVWIGASVVVMKGTNIGNGSVIGILSMVTKDIPSSSVAVGQPAKVVKEDVHWTREL